MQHVGLLRVEVLNGAVNDVAEAHASHNARVSCMVSVAKVQKPWPHFARIRGDATTSLGVNAVVRILLYNPDVSCAALIDR